MPLLSSRVLRFGRSWLRGPPACEETETPLDRDGRRVPASLLRPAGSNTPLPAWVVLHGLTRAGRGHAALARFTRALVSSGTVAIVPEVPEWRELSLSPHLATPTVRAAVRGLRDSAWALDGPVGVIGFSFGAPHGIVASTDPELAGRIAGTVGFGGYCDIRSTFRFMMTGSPEPNGVPSDSRPDPYGRWIVGSNYLTEIPELSDHGDVASALRDLALHAGDVGDPSTGGVYDPVIAELRSRLPSARREVFDLFAPPSAALPDRAAAVDIADRLAAAASLKDPTLDPTRALGRVERPVHILHARYDRLISYTEASKLHRALPSATTSKVTITTLFGHSGENRFSAVDVLRELPGFSKALRDVLDVPSTSNGHA